MSEDRRGDGVGPQVLVALALHLMRELDHLGAGPCDLERDLDGPGTRCLDLLSRAHRLDEREVRARVELDQLLGAEPQRLGGLVRFRGAAPAWGADGDLLQQRGRGGEDRGRRGTARRRGLA